MTRRPGEPGTGTVAAAGAVGIALALASVVLPYAAFLSRPDVLALVCGLAVLVSGLVLLRAGATGPVGWLVVGAACCWFIPELAVSGARTLDIALRCTALLHVALLVHAVVVVGSPRVHGSLERLTVAIGYAAALTAAVGGYQVALPAAGGVLVVAVLRSGRRLPHAVRTSRAAAGLVLGVGLIVDAVLRLTIGASAESWVSAGHPVEVGLTAVLLAVAGTRAPEWDTIDVSTEGMASLTAVIAAELRVASLDIALSDGSGGWLTPAGAPRAAPPGDGYAVRDGSGEVWALLGGSVGPPIAPAVANLLRLAATNARLRRSIVGQVDELEASRRRLLAAADSERAALGTQLRARVIAQVAAIERDLARSTALAPARERAATTRHALETISRGFDPVGADRTLRRALERLSDTASCTVVVEQCDEPHARDVARALWFCCAEAATNTSKHSAGSTLRVGVRRDGGQLHATITDDGPGGANPLGAGLRGLADRVETLGGGFELTSSPRGTSLSITLADVAEDCGQPQHEVAGDADPLEPTAAYRRSHGLLGGTS